jgi:CMP-N,N'-diacetyllegionaminic acid synthase
VEVLGIVPARGGSRRVPRKNLAVLEGRTLVRRTLEVALASGALADVCLTSEDPEILAEGRALPGARLVRRPPELATDDARSYDVIRHALAETEAATGRAYEAICVLQCTTPFTEPDDVRATTALLAADEAAGSAVSVVEVDMVHHPAKLKLLEGGRLVPFLAPDGMTPSHELPRLYVRNGAVYVTHRNLFDAGTFVAEDALAHVMPQERSVDIDTPLDLAFAQFLAGRRRCGER